MELLVLVWRQYRWPFISVMALSLASAALGIGLIAFINQRLIETADTSLLVLPEFLGLLLLLMAVTLGSQLALTTLGHHFVYRLRSEFIKRILDTRRNAPLSPASLEVLAVIAYNQPVSRSFIEQVRGVDSSSTVAKLLEKGLIEEAGRLDLPGKPVAFRVTDTFLRVFGLGSLADLPPLHDEKEEGLTQDAEQPADGEQLEMQS